MAASGDPSNFSLLGFHGGSGGGGGDVLRDYAVREINALLWISLIAVTALLLRKVVALLRLWSKGRRIPGPPCPSFYGHSKLISAAAGPGDNLNDFLSKSHEKYGSMVRLWLGPSQLLVSFKDPLMIKEVLEKAEDKLPLTGRAFRLAFGQSSLFVSSFEKVQQGRESLAIQLNGKLLERAKEVSLKVVDRVMERIDSIMTKGLLDCRAFSQHMAFSILGATLFGEKFLALSSATAYEELMMLIAKDACFWASFNIPPIWKRGFWRYRRSCRKLKCLTQDIVRQCKHTYKLFSPMGLNVKRSNTSDFGKEAVDDVMCYSEGIMTGGLCLQEFNSQEFCGNIMGMMFHGCLTTASLIGSILTRLVMHPEIQDQIYSEIMKEQEMSTEPEGLDMHNSTLLLATVYEAARLLPAGPLLQRCSINHDLILKSGITVPAGAILVVPVQLVQLDESCWGTDAKKFNPYRFISKSIHQQLNVEDANICLEDSFKDDLKENAAFLPFGSGSRACVGRKFAILAITTLFASLLQNYEIKLQPGSVNDPKPTINNCMLQLLPSPKIMLVKRNC